jgi:outer membrane lipoprotein-sorting protein
MRTAWCVCLTGVVLSACLKVRDETAIIASAKQLLAEREKRLTSYRIEVESRSEQLEAQHTFFFRSPNLMAGEIRSPQRLQLAFNGSHLFKQLDSEKKRVDYALALPQAEAALLLAQTFNPFVPEGFRTPLLPMRGIRARQAAHPLEPKAIELIVEQVDDGVTVSMTYVLRADSGDFLAKRVTRGTTVIETTVVEERCDEALHLCVPRKLVERNNGVQVASTELKKIELNVPLPNDGFTLTAPADYQLESKKIERLDQLR